MNKNIFNFPKLFIFVLIFIFSGCSKNNESQSREKTVDEIIAEDAKRNLSILPIDPAVCENNPEGYVYFQFGEEVFRYTKNSPIKIALIFPNVEPRLSRKIKDTDIPEGCEGNPYTAIGLQPKFTKDNNPFGQFRFRGFGLGGVLPEKKFTISPAQKLMEDSFDRFKKNNKPCENFEDGLERCIWPTDDRPREEWSVVYQSSVAIYASIGNSPFTMNCYKFAAAGLFCETSYRLYPSIDIYYSFYPKDNNFEDKNILILDKYMRELFESMRVKINL